MSVDIFNLSDEELLKLDPSTLVDDTPAAAAPAASNEDPVADAGEVIEPAGDETTNDEVDGVLDDGAGQDGGVVAGDEGAKATDPAGEGQAPDGGTATEVKAEAAPGTPASTEAKPADKPADKPEATPASAPADVQAEYNKLLAPFVANGREMSVKNVDEAITLMQMGANYNKKMAALAPNLKLVKLLETHGLMSEEKISYLIDLSNKDSGAINKLVKESGIDPMDLTAENADKYKPTVRTVNDKELELDSVLEEIQETPTYQRTLGVVGKEWDAASRQVVAEAPELLRVINNHVQSGVFDVIKAEVERERTFGRLRGISDIEAYRQVGDKLQASGGFDHLNPRPGNQGQQAPAAAPVVVQPNPKKVEEEAKLNEKRKAAGASKPVAASSGVPKDFNPLAMSDEEFSKLVKPNFI